MTRQLLFPALFVFCSLTALTAPCPGEDWPGWRGPRGDGTSLETGIPTRWDGSSGENIAWQVPIPGRAHSSPIVWGDRIFVTTCLEDSEDRRLLCLDRQQGQLLWQRTTVTSPLEKKHNLNSYASGTPVTDGQLVYVTFLEADFASLRERTPGNIVVAAYDYAGRQVWVVRPGDSPACMGSARRPSCLKIC